MNWLQLMSKIFAAVPVAVAGVEAIDGEKDGTTKKQLALDSLGLSSAVAQLVAPNQKQAIDAATKAAGDAIDGVVQVANASGDFNKATAATTLSHHAIGGVATDVAKAA